MSTFYIVIGVILVCFGLMLILSKNTAWKWQVWQNSLRGLPSMRTANWEAGSTVQGYFCIAIGIVLIGFTFYNISRQSEIDIRQERIRRELLSPLTPR